MVWAVGYISTAKHSWSTHVRNNLQHTFYPMFQHQPPPTYLQCNLNLIYISFSTPSALTLPSHQQLVIHPVHITPASNHLSPRTTRQSSVLQSCSSTTAHPTTTWKTLTRSTTSKSRKSVLSPHCAKLMTSTASGLYS